MPLVISDDVLKQAKLSENEALVEIACRLFDAGKLTLPAAGKLAGLARVEMEAELISRNIPVYRPTVEDLKSDLQSMKKLGL